MKKADCENGAQILIEQCGCVNYNDKALILVDEGTELVGRYLLRAAKRITNRSKLVMLKREKMHGVEPIADVAQSMLESTVIFCATTFSLAHTSARINATNNGARFLSLPDYSVALLGRKSLRVDYQKQAVIARKIKNILDLGKTVEVTSRKGTKIQMDIAERLANCCPGFCDMPGMMGSPPDIETNIAPWEEKSSGMLIADGSIPCDKIGPLKDDIVCELEHGLLSTFKTTSLHSGILANMMDSPKKRVLAEFGIGLNPKASLSGIMLEDEGCLGTVHFGFGSNATIGGINRVNFHLDVVMQLPTVKIDGIPIMKEGVLTIV